MEEFLHALVAFLSANTPMPPEVTVKDVLPQDREKTYLQTLPPKPAKAWSIRIYDGTLPTLTNKQAGIYRVQIIVRNPRQGEAFRDISSVWQFLINRPEYIEDMDSQFWVIFDVQSVPIFLEQDEAGNYLYSLNFPVKTKMF